MIIKWDDLKRERSGRVLIKPRIILEHITMMTGFTASFFKVERYMSIQEWTGWGSPDNVPMVIDHKGMWIGGGAREKCRITARDFQAGMAKVGIEIEIVERENAAK